MSTLDCDPNATTSVRGGLIWSWLTSSPRPRSSVTGPDQAFWTSAVRNRRRKSGSPSLESVDRVLPGESTGGTL
ncbi:hypothetical protein BT67DRAFT_276660 [Trichocladium antarcticum]|uniref:Uncharacterized protein n=1 Tax=Trichocladium antarcticum TaxID=1450529 RepID=A0AAN6UM73_9PEZI|nr:hypothetical protein BT67DRAFT_276660 [Trichocladium antarcticum]